MAEQKTREKGPSRSNILFLLYILEEYSDENHILTQKNIISKMETCFNRKIERRAIYAALDELEDFGYEISRYEDNGVGYYLMERKFSLAEIRLLIDAIYSCPYISQKQTEELLKKLRGFLSEHDRKGFNYTNIITSDKKSPNAEVFLNIEILDQAINSHKQISFTYMDYDYSKKLVAKREKPYIVNPYSMICKDSHYYLVLIYQGQTTPSFYRIDMMKNIKILDTPVEISKRNAKLDSVKKVVYAHSGEPQRCQLKCDKKALRYVIEEFGNDTNIMEKPDGSFEASFIAAPEGLVYWALQFSDCVEVVSPKQTRDAVISVLKNNKYGV